jgi:hypothetical protein
LDEPSDASADALTDPPYASDEAIRLNSITRATVTNDDTVEPLVPADRDAGRGWRRR